MIGRYLGRRPTLACLWHTISRGSGGMPPPPPGNFENAFSLGDAFSLILGAKSRAFRTDSYQVTGNKVMMAWSVECFYCLLIFSSLKLKKLHNTNGPRIIFLSISRHYKAIIFQPAQRYAIWHSLFCIHEVQMPLTIEPAKWTMRCE